MWPKTPQEALKNLQDLPQKLPRGAERAPREPSWLLKGVQGPTKNLILAAARTTFSLWESQKHIRESQGALDGCKMTPKTRLDTPRGYSMQTNKVSMFFKEPYLPQDTTEALESLQDLS